MENKIYLNQEQIEALKALVNHLDEQIQKDREARAERQLQNSVENFKKFAEKHNGIIQEERAKLDQQKRDERIHEISVELAYLSKDLFEKETEFRLLQFKKDDLIAERKELFAENAAANGWKF